MNALNTAAGETLIYKRAMSGNAHVLSLSARKSPAAVEAIARKLAALPDVEYAEPDYMMRPLLTPDDPSYAAQWHYHGPQGINAPAAWDITTGSAAVRVAVIDTGITDHPDLAGQWVGGDDFIADVPTAAGANSGGLKFWIDGAQQTDLTGVDNDTRRIDQVRLGAANGVDNGTRGTYFFDAFESRRLTFIGP